MDSSGFLLNIAGQGFNLLLWYGSLDQVLYFAAGYLLGSMGGMRGLIGESRMRQKAKLDHSAFRFNFEVIALNMNKFLASDIWPALSTVLASLLRDALHVSSPLTESL